jgi:hypothetical protein
MGLEVDSTEAHQMSRRRRKSERIQPSATRPLFCDNLHLGQIAKSVNLDVVHSFGKIVKRQVCVKNGGELPTAV